MSIIAPTDSGVNGLDDTGSAPSRSGDALPARGDGGRKSAHRGRAGLYRATMDVPQSPAGRGERQIIWTREVQNTAIARRWRQFLMFFVGPAVLALAVGALVGGVGAFLGLAILLGLFGLLLFGLVFFKNLSAKQNQTIVCEGDHLVLGHRRVDLDRVESWSTRSDDPNWGVGSQALFGNPMAGNAITAQVLFRLTVLDAAGQRLMRPDGGARYEIIDFAWAEMPEDHLDRLRHAIAPFIRAPYVTFEQLSI